MSKTATFGSLVLAAILLSGCCWSKASPIGLGRLTYYSQDLDLIKVNISTCSFNSPSTCVQKIRRSFEIPRAYITMALPYTKKTHCALPNEIFARYVRLAIAAPDGAPVSRSKYSVMVSDEARLKTMWVNLHATPETVSETAKRYSRPSTRWKPSGSWENLTRYGDRKYYGDAGAGIRRIYCTSGIKKARKFHWCNYIATVADGLYVNAVYADFRVNGGLEPARERMRIVRKTICRYVDCDR